MQFTKDRIYESIDGWSCIILAPSPRLSTSLSQTPQTPTFAGTWQDVCPISLQFEAILSSLPS